MGMDTMTIKVSKQYPDYAAVSAQAIERFGLAEHYDPETDSYTIPADLIHKEILGQWSLYLVSENRAPRERTAEGEEAERMLAELDTLDPRYQVPDGDWSKGGGWELKH